MKPASLLPLSAARVHSRARRKRLDRELEGERSRGSSTGRPARRASEDIFLATMPEGDLRDLFAVVERVSSRRWRNRTPLTAEDNADELAAKYGTHWREESIHRQADDPTAAGREADTKDAGESASPAAAVLSVEDEEAEKTEARAQDELDDETVRIGAEFLLQLEREAAEEEEAKNQAETARRLIIAREQAALEDAAKEEAARKILIAREEAAREAIARLKARESENKAEEEKAKTRAVKEREEAKAKAEAELFAKAAAEAAAEAEAEAAAAAEAETAAAAAAEAEAKAEAQASAEADAKAEAEAHAKAMAEEKAKKTIAVETKVPEAKAKTEIQSDADVEAAPGESAAAAHWAEADGVATTKTRSAVSDGLTVGSQWNHDSFSSIPAETVSPSASDDLDEVFQSEQKEGESSSGGSSRRLPTLDKFLWNLGCFFGGFIGAVILSKAGKPRRRKETGVAKKEKESPAEPTEENSAKPRKRPSPEPGAPAGPNTASPRVLKEVFAA